MDQTQQKRGLGALLQKTSGMEARPLYVSTVPVSSIRPNPNQPRKGFDEDALSELSDSIKANGVIQPVVLRSVQPSDATQDVRYELVAGERRWIACKRAGLSEIPAIIRTVSSDSDVLLISLIENIQRDDLNPIEEAVSYKRLMETFGIGQEHIASSVGKSRPYISNSIRLLELPESIQQAIRSGKLSVGHAKVLLGIDDRRLQSTLAAKCQAEGLTVRQLEAFAIDDAKSETLRSRMGKISRRSAPSHLINIQDKLSKHFGTKVTVEEGARKGKIAIEFYSVSDFDRITKLMGLTDT